MTASVQKQKTKTEDGKSFPSSAYAYVPDPEKPSTWKIRLFSDPSDVPGNPSVRITAAAVLALSPSGFRGNRAKIPAAALPGVKAKVKAAWIKARRQAGESDPAADLPSILKVNDPETEPEVVGKAVKLDLDEAGEEAFDRLVANLPKLAEAVESVSVLSKALVEDDPGDPQDGYGLADALNDVRTVAGQVKDEEAREQLVKAEEALSLAVPQAAKGDLSTGDLATGGGLKNPSQGARTTLEVRQRGDDWVVVDVISNEVLFTGTEEAARAKLAELRKDDVEKKAFEVRIIKAEDEEDDEDERTVFGIVLEPETVDSQGDIYSEDEIRKTAYRFMEVYQQFGLMHKRLVQTVLPLESFLAPVDFDIEGQKVKKGTWLLRVRVLDDSIWKRVKKGELTGFSIGGSAIRTPEGKAAA